MAIEDSPRNAALTWQLVQVLPQAHRGLTRLSYSDPGAAQGSQLLQAGGGLIRLEVPKQGPTDLQLSCRPSGRCN